MSNFKERMISLFKIILTTVLGLLLILGGSGYAQAVLLKPNTAYKVDRTPDIPDPNSSCYDETAQVKFTFTGSEFTGGEFEETYPIQDGWDLFFHTPKTSGPFEFQDLNDCGLSAEEDSLELLSGFKSKDEADSSSEHPPGQPTRKREAHFVVAKDYYAYSETSEEYTPLGSLTAIGGTEYPALRGAAIGQLIIEPNSIRAPHWHLKYNETGYCYGGLGQVGIIVPGNTIPKGGEEEGFFGEPRVEEFFVQDGEIFHFPEATQHYLRNVGQEPFSCTLFFAEGEAISDDNLLTITLSNIVSNTPLGVLGPILATDRDPSATDTPPMYTAQRVSEAPRQTYSSAEQGPEIVKVVEACRGVDPDVDDPGCPSVSDLAKEAKKPQRTRARSGFSVYSTLKP